MDGLRRLRGGPILTRVAWATMALAGIAVPRVSSAQADEEPVRVEYTAAAGCPSEGAFFAEVLARTRRARRAADGAPARTFAVALTAEGGESAGTLVIRAADGTFTQRDVTGDTCGEVASALALIAALAVDPAASTRPVPLPVAPAPLVAEPPPHPWVAPVAAPSADAARRWHLALTFGASVASGAPPGALFGVSPMVAVIAPPGTWLAPTLHVGVQEEATGAIDVGGPTATFTSTLGIVEGCPNRWTLGSLSVEPCVRLEVGDVRGAGSDIVPARDNVSPWLAIGAMGRAEWQFYRPMFLDIEAGGRASLLRTTYLFEPGTTIFRPPTVGGIVGAGIGVRFL